MKKQFDQEQIIAIPREGKAGTPVKELWRKHKSTDATFYTRRKKYGGRSETPEAARG